MLVAYYHNHCPDGLGAAWAFEQSLNKDAVSYVLYPVEYNRPIKGYGENDDIVFVDFCPTVENIKEMVEANVRSIHIIDHHASAFAVREACESMPSASMRNTELKFTLDLNMSGATLTYRTLVDNEGAIPQVLLHIEDRDLWRHALKVTEAISAVVASCEDVAQFGEMMKRPFEDILTEGRVLQAARKASIAKVKRTYDVGGVPMVLHNNKRVGIIHVPIPLASDIASQLLLDNGNIDAIINCTPNLLSRRVKLSIRSRHGQALEIAEALGGGGHQNAAGAEITINQFHSTFDDKFEFVENAFTSIYEYKDGLEVDVIGTKTRGPVTIRRELVHTEEGVADLMCVYSADGRWLSDKVAVFWKMVEMNIEEFVSTGCPRMAVYGRLASGEYFCWKDEDVRVFHLGSEVTREDEDYYLPHDMADACHHMEVLASKQLGGVECKVQTRGYMNYEGQPRVGFVVYTPKEDYLVMDMYNKFGSPSRLVNTLADGERLALEALECFKPELVLLEDNRIKSDI